MASKLANEIYTAVLSVDADQPSAPVAIDVELSEVREVLEGLQTFWIDQGANAPVEWHWCDPDADCTDDCQRARTLYEKLEIK